MYKEALALSPLRSLDHPVTGAAVHLLLRRLWNRLGIGVWLDDRLADLPDQFRPSLMIQIAVTLLFYGGWMAVLEWFGRRGVLRRFGWARVPVRSTFGRWLRLAGAPVADILEELIRRIVRLRWELRGVPVSLALVLDSTVIFRYGTEQAGAECGYIPPEARPAEPSPNRRLRPGDRRPDRAPLVDGRGGNRLAAGACGLAPGAGRGGDHRPAGQGIPCKADRPQHGATRLS